MSTTRYRVVLSVLGLLLGLLVVGAVILAPSGDVTELPDAVERFFPGDGAIVQRQTALEVDLQAGYSLTLTINGVRVPEEDIKVIEATAFYEFRPGPDKVITEWLPGFHVIEIEFDRIAGLPDPGSLRWSFRTQ